MTRKTASTAHTDDLDVLLIDFDSIALVDNGEPVEIVEFTEKDGFFLKTDFTKDFRIRKSVYDRVRAAQKHLPDNYYFAIYEAYRPLARQVSLWNMATAYLKEKYPEKSESDILELTETFVANPFNGIGSGHQACCAIDVGLCDRKGREYDMGTGPQQMNEFSKTRCSGISDEARRNREILVNALEREGMINYPAEWWHFSHGDHQWAYLVKETEACYGPLDL